jgi:hypothetical protein
LHAFPPKEIVLSPQDFENQVRSNLNNRTTVTPELIRQIIRLTLDIQGPEAPHFTDKEVFIEQMARSLEERLDICMPDATVIQLPFKEWLSERRTSVADLYFWDRYRKSLLQDGFGKEVVGTISRDTDKIVGLLEDPTKTGPWKRRGLVVGHVQSGKTANYNGVICKSADYGYKIIILLAGVHNNLRSQTQQRVEEAFIGVDTDKKDRNLPLRECKTGAGRLGDEMRIPFSLTSREHDFRKDSAKAATFSLNAVREPVVLVIKKQTSVLKNLVEWLNSLNETTQGKICNVPMLLIDDEADNASINVAKGDNPTKINGQIRTLLKMFEQSSYIGYTATPFANIFIDPESEHEMFEDDLFPKDFIVSLEAPDNYVSAARMFGEDGDLSHLLQPVSDHLEYFPERHKIDHKIFGLPPSLTEAVRKFLLGRAVRILRGRGHDHSSMLVNVSRFNLVQQQVTSYLTDYLEEMRNSIKLHAGLADKDGLKDPGIRALYETWTDMLPSQGESWDQVKPCLLGAVGPVVVRTINNKSSDRLDYKNHKENGLHVIAVGGLSLSRGFTLEGLMVSYFIRNSIMYDTLLQMGRWFGYRDGYIDLCSLYMTEEAQSWYSHISSAIDELRAEFRLMEQQGRKPSEFGLKVRTHPESLIVTARNKMRSGKKVLHTVALDGRLIETAYLKSDPEVINNNRDLLKALLNKMQGAGDYKKIEAGYLWKEIPVDIVSNFITRFQNHDDASAITQARPVIDFIQSDADRFGLWDVCLYSLKSGDKISFGLLDVIQQERSCKEINSCYQVSGQKMRVASRGAEQAGLELNEKQLTELKELNEKHNGNVPDYVYRSFRSRPLLMLHLLDLRQSGNKENKLANVVCAWGISFPGLKGGGNGKKVEYMVNPIWWSEQHKEEIEELEEVSDEGAI